MDNGELKKMIILAFENPRLDLKIGLSGINVSGSPGANIFTAMYNPNTYSQRYVVDYCERQAPGDSGSPLVFNKIRPQEYSFEFWFDGTGASDSSGNSGPVDVSRKVDSFLNITGAYNGETHRPPFLKIIWGTLSVGCVLKSAEVNYTLFKPDGRPLRAKVRAVFTESVEDTLRVRLMNPRSPDLSHAREVEEGDNLPLMSQKVYDDPAFYLQIAKHNKLKHFRRLKIGKQLDFPPIRNVNE